MVGCLQQEKELSLLRILEVCSSWIILPVHRGGRKSCVLILSISVCALEFTNKLEIENSLNPLVLILLTFSGTGLAADQHS